MTPLDIGGKFLLGSPEYHTHIPNYAFHHRQIAVIQNVIMEYRDIMKFRSSTWFTSTQSTRFQPYRDANDVFLLGF